MSTGSRQLAVAAFALAEAACLWLCLAVLGRGLGGTGAGPLLGLPAVVLLAHTLGAVALPEALRRRGVPAGRRALLHNAAMLLALAATGGLAVIAGGEGALGQDTAGLVFGALGLAFVWWRGAALAAEGFAHGALLGEWRGWAIAAVAAVLLGMPTLALDGTAGVALAVFLTGGLVTLAAAWRHEQLGGRERGRAALGGTWAVTVGSLVLVIILPAVLGAAVLGPSFTAVVLGLLGGLATVLLWVLSPLLLATGWIVALLIELARALQGGARGRQPLLHVPNHGPPNPSAVTTLHPPLWLTVLGVAVVVAVVLALYLLAVRRVMAVRSSATVSATAVEEDREALLSWREAWAALLAWLGRLGRRGYPPPAPGGGAMGAGAAAVGAPTTLSVREIYRRLLALGAALGTARRPMETPYEYLAHLRRGLHAREKEVSLITAAYVQVRYGPHPATSQQVAQAHEAWARVEAEAAAAASAQPGAPEPRSGPPERGWGR